MGLRQGRPPIRLGAQDGDIAEPIAFEAESVQEDAAVVAMRYAFVLDPGAAPGKHAVHLALKKEGARCWRLDDFITPRGADASVRRRSGAVRGRPGRQGKRRALTSGLVGAWRRRGSTLDLPGRAERPPAGTLQAFSPGRPGSPA